ncbi:MAG: hypothetical protein JJE04_09265 [Acidobacteriia bacterium]|nr:hypothetical protein [Terriglobia bacterium]
MQRIGKGTGMGAKRLLAAPLLLLSAPGLAPVALAQSPGTFTTTGSMGMPRTDHTATLLLNGKVLICGGSTSGRSAELYDPASGTFTTTGEMTMDRWNHTATLLPDGIVLIAGGGYAAEHTAPASSEVYDPATGVFTATASMMAARRHHTATLLRNGKVLISGGWGRLGPQIPGYSRWASAELYDPATGAFSSTGEMRAERLAHTATLLADGKVLITSGEGQHDGAIPWVELYDPGTGAFHPGGEVGSSDTVGPQTVSLLTSGRVLVGLTNPYNVPTNGAKLYDPATATFADTGNMRAARAVSAGVLLATGKVLLTGYAQGSGSAEVYDPASGAFLATGEMVTPRGGHTATLLSDGTVLISGGSTGSNRLVSAELYHPDARIPAPILLSLVGNRQGQGAIQHGSTYQVVSPDNPAVAGEILVIYCTGLADGSVIPPQIAIGGRMAEIMWFGKTTGYEGLNQVNVRMPSGVMPGSAVPVRLTYIGRPSNEVTIGVR